MRRPDRTRRHGANGARLRRLLPLAAVIALTAIVGAPADGAVSAVPSNDNATGKIALSFGVPATTSTLSASTGTGDPLTPVGDGTCFGDVMGKTVWYFVVGDGHQITLSTAGSNFDTLLSYYGGSRGIIDLLGCNNDASATDRTSIVSFPSIAGHLYNIEVGGFDAGGTAAPPPAAGNLTLTATTDAPVPPPPPSPVVVPPPPPPPPPAKPTPRLSIDAAMRVTPRTDGVLVRYLRVYAPHDARVSVSCPRKRCQDFARIAAHGTSSRLQRITDTKLTGRVLRSGTQVRIFVTRAGAIGRYVKYSISKGDIAKSNTSCLSRALKPRACD
jgi:hypothetical protein